jgi:hypothetical protein
MTKSEFQYSTYTDWEPKKYLSDYYSEVMPDERFSLEFLIDSLCRLSSVPVALDFGSGPVISHIMPLVAKAEEIHVSEYLASNLVELQKWLSTDADAHDWRSFTLEVLRLEGCPNPTESEAQLREDEVRRRVTKLLPGDVRESNPLGLEKQNFYPLVTAHYCAEGISPNKEEWRKYMTNIMTMVQPEGVLITSSCGSGKFYRVGDLYFPSTELEPQDVLSCFWENGFVDVDLRIRQLPDYSEQGFFYTIFACGVKSEGQKS